MKSPKVARRRPEKVPHGIPRSQAQILRLTDALENAMLYAVPKARWGKILALADLPVGASAAEQAAAEPVPSRTVADYVARVTKRWEEEPLPTRRKARARQVRRLYAQIAALHTKGLHGEIEKRERLLARIEGTEAPKVVHLAGEGGGPIQTENETTAVTLTSGELRARAALVLATAKAKIATAAARALEAGESDPEAG